MVLSYLLNGKIIREQTNNINFDLSCDVLCVGAGAAGVYAADSAASMGADVILLELGSNIGGMHVCGNVTGYYHGSRGGAHEEEHKKTLEDTVFLSSGAHWEQKQIHITNRLKNSSVRLFCHSSATGIYFEDNRAVGLKVFNGEKEVNVRAEIIIDATSDGHLIRMTDTVKYYGRSADKRTVPFTVRTQYYKNKSLISNNEDSGYTDQYDETDFSEKTIMAHAFASRFLKEGEFISVALHTGIREGLSFAGEECASYKDIIMGKVPKKVLFWAYSDLDRHGNDRSCDDELFQNWWVISNLATVTINIPVPMGSVVPKGVKGLVTAGRCLCCDTYSQSAIRMNRDMFRMGECVGIAAALAVKSKVDFLNIDYNEYLKTVKEKGCFNQDENRFFGYENFYAAYLKKMKTLNRIPDPKYAHLAPYDTIYTPVEFSVEKTFQSLKTDAPATAIWSCYIHEDKNAIKEKLFAEMENADTPIYKNNCAIALGLLKDERALPVLRSIVDNRDCFYFTDNRRSNQFRSVIAVCLLGRFGKKEDLNRLFDILGDSEAEKEMYHTLKADYLYHEQNDRNFLYFYIFTHACASIIKIYKKSAMPLSELNAFFTDLFSGNKILRRITSAEKGEPAYNEVVDFINNTLNEVAEN
ncbi:MAG: FAD-dependent oxidoreductase [Clostridia bacterium]|nr:FAD-dependent oxidoreductase [Clostridia bacterium]